MSILIECIFLLYHESEVDKDCFLYGVLIHWNNDSYTLIYDTNQGTINYSNYTFDTKDILLAEIKLLSKTQFQSCLNKTVGNVVLGVEKEGILIADSFTINKNKLHSVLFYFTDNTSLIIYNTDDEINVEYKGNASEKLREDTWIHWINAPHFFTS